MHSTSTAAALAATGIAMALAFSIGLGPPSRDRPSAGPAVVERLSCPLPARAHARLELLFGSMLPGGQSVSEADWLDFVDAEITPRFPEGLTVLTGTGQWRNARGEIIREPARVLVIWYRPVAQSEATIAAIRNAYRLRFQQESVMRVDGASCVTF